MDRVVADKMTKQSESNVLQLDPGQRGRSLHQKTTRGTLRDTTHAQKNCNLGRGEISIILRTCNHPIFSWKPNAYLSSLFFKYVLFLPSGLQAWRDYPPASGVCAALIKHTCFITLWLQSLIFAHHPVYSESHLPQR